MKVFDRLKLGREAVREMLLLHQGNQSVSDYAIQFRTLATSTEWNTEALYDTFFQGLSEDIKDKLIPHALPTDFEQLVDMAIRIDVRREQRHKTQRSLCHLHQGNPLIPAFSPRPPGVPEPMQVDRTCLSPAEKEWRWIDRVCFYFGQLGHFVQVCPLKGRAHQK